MTDDGGEASTGILPLSRSSLTLDEMKTLRGAGRVKIAGAFLLADEGMRLARISIVFWEPGEVRQAVVVVERCATGDLMDPVWFSSLVRQAHGHFYEERSRR